VHLGVIKVNGAKYRRVNRFRIILAAVDTRAVLGLSFGLFLIWIFLHRLLGSESLACRTMKVMPTLSSLPTMLLEGLLNLKGQRSKKLK